MGEPSLRIASADAAGAPVVRPLVQLGELHRRPRIWRMQHPPVAGVDADVVDVRPRAQPEEDEVTLAQVAALDRYADLGLVRSVAREYDAQRPEHAISKARA